MIGKSGRNEVITVQSDIVWSKGKRLRAIADRRVRFAEVFMKVAKVVVSFRECGI